MSEQNPPNNLNIILPQAGEVPVAPVGAGPQEILDNLESVASGAARRIVEHGNAVQQKAQLQADLETESAAHQKTHDLMRSTARLALEFQQTAETLEENVIRDELTGLLNLRGLRETYKQFNDTRRRLQKGDQIYSDAVLFLDLDKFAELNSILGHGGADEVLKTAARIIEASTRITDIRVRRSGDEFIIILPDTMTEDAVSIGDKIREAIEKSEATKHSTASIGVAVITPDAVEEGIKQANEAMYGVKKSGKNRVEVYKGESS